MAQAPAELIEEILSYLTRSELKVVASVNRSFSSAVQSLLYTSIDLSSAHRDVRHTLNLLQDNVTLGLKIRSATLRTAQRHAFVNEPWIAPSLFKCWTGLKSLRLFGSPFRSVFDRELFQAVLTQNCRMLSSISFIPNADMEMAGIMGPHWGAQNTTVETKLRTADLFHIHSVTHLSFGGNVIHAPGRPLDSLLQLYFPNLIAFESGALSTCDNLQWSEQSLTLFLSRHPTIQFLSLGKDVPTTDIFFQLHPPLLTHTFLPHLQSFEGFPENVAVMARAQAPFLYRLETLSLVSSYDDWRDIDNMFNALAGTSLARLRHLNVELYRGSSLLDVHSNVTFVAHRTWMIAFANLCPNVTEMYVRLPPLYGPTLGMIFSGYESLEVLSLPHLSLVHMPLNGEMDYFRAISRTCPRLRQIRARRPGHLQRDDLYSFHRNAAGTLLSMTIDS